MPVTDFYYIYGFVQLDSPNGELPLSVDPSKIITVGSDFDRVLFQVESTGDANMYWIKSFNGTQYVMKTDSGILMLGDSPFSWRIDPVDRKHSDIFHLSTDDSTDIELWTMDNTDDGSAIIANTANSSINRKQRWKFKKADGPKLD